MSKANHYDRTYAESGRVVEYTRWPAVRGALMDDNGTLRPMTPAELHEWDTEEATSLELAEREQLRSLMQSLRTISNWSTTQNTANLTSAVRTLARFALYLARDIER